MKTNFFGSSWDENLIYHLYMLPHYSEFWHLQILFLGNGVCYNFFVTIFEKIGIPLYEKSTSLWIWIQLKLLQLNNKIFIM